MDLGLIRDLETTTLMHSSRVYLFRPGEGVYLDKSYFGVKTLGYSEAMRRAQGQPLGIRDRLRNRSINRRRAPGERPFAVIKRVFNADHVLVTMVPWVHMKVVFACVCFNLL